MADTTYAAASGELNAYVAEPAGAGPWPGVVVVMDALGLSHDIKAQADRLAAAGYLAFAPDLYSGRGLRCVLATLRASRSGQGPAYGDLKAARDWLAAREDCTGRIGIIGFCMGGGFAIQAAPQLPFDAASVNYGEIPKDPDRRLAGSCPVVGSYGAKDVSLRNRAARLEHALEHLGVPHDIKEYPDAGHSFMNRLEVPSLFGSVVSLLSFDYRHDASEDSWERILRFFGDHLHQ